MDSEINGHPSIPSATLMSRSAARPPVWLRTLISNSAVMATNITWHEGVTQAERESLTAQKSATIWFTGLSGPSSHLVSQPLCAAAKPDCL